MIHNARIARDAVSALGCFGHLTRIPPHAVDPPRPLESDVRYLLNRALTGPQDVLDQLASECATRSAYGIRASGRETAPAPKSGS